VINNEVGPDAPLPQECSDQVANMSTLQDDLQERTQVIQRDLDSLAKNLKRDVDILATMTQEVHAPRSKSTTAQKQTFSCLDTLEVYCEEKF
jgi:ABC-type phosphate transport system auxiliary subunit